MTVAIIKDRHVRIIIMRPETILHRGRIHFRRLLLVPTNSSCSSAADHTCYVNDTELPDVISFFLRTVPVLFPRTSAAPVSGTV